MTAPPAVTHGFRLYRSGWSDGVPWSDNQLWADLTTVLDPDAENTLTLRPAYGSAASLYRVRLAPDESPETGWCAWRAHLEIDMESMAGGDWLPLAWYVGTPSDWPSGLARFPEGHGPQVPGKPYGVAPFPRGVWTLAARRAS